MIYEFNVHEENIREQAYYRWCQRYCLKYNDLPNFDESMKFFKMFRDYMKQPSDKNEYWNYLLD